MCGRYILVQNTEVLEKRFNVIMSNHFDWKPNYNIGPGTFAPIIISEVPNQIQISQFGLTPFWAKKPMYLFNARTEGNRNKDNLKTYSGSKDIITKPAFRKPIRSQRCLVLADAFIEGTTSEGLSNPYLVYLRNKQRPFAFAGIYDVWKNPKTGEELTSFSIITTVANKLMQKIPHHRSPVILHPSMEARWLNAKTPLTDITNMLKPYDSDLMNAYPINADIKSSRSNTPEIIQPKGSSIYAESNVSTSYNLELQGMGARKKYQS